MYQQTMTNRVDITLPILALDPGPTKTAWVVLREGKPGRFGHDSNQEVLEIVMQGPWEQNHTVIEQIASMGMAVGEEVFETCVWSGRFMQAVECKGGTMHRIKRGEVKMHLCGSMRANDANIRQAIIDRYGGKEKAIGNKKNPGPLRGVAGDVWAALAVALTYQDRVTVARADVGGGE